MKDKVTLWTLIIDILCGLDKDVLVLACILSSVLEFVVDNRYVKVEGAAIMRCIVTMRANLVLDSVMNNPYMLCQVTAGIGCIFTVRTH